jgi:hypothetical protein
MKAAFEIGKDPHEVLTLTQQQVVDFLDPSELLPAGAAHDSR